MIAPSNRARWLGLLLAFVLVSLLLWGGVALFDPRVFPIRHVSVTGDYHYLKPTEVRQLLKQALYPRSFFSVSVNALRNLLEDMPWVGQARVRRVGRDTLVIHIEERQFVARWGTGALLSTDGKIIPFPKKNFPSPLPVFWGKPLQAPGILAEYRSFSEKLRPLGLKISAISLDARESWRVKLTTGVVVELGRSEFDKKFDRFINFYGQYLSRREDKVAAVDMRYTNGASVLWKSA